MFKPSSKLNFLTDRSNALFVDPFLLFVFVFVILSFLFLVALWSPAEKELISSLSCVLIVSFPDLRLLPYFNKDTYHLVQCCHTICFFLFLYMSVTFGMLKIRQREK